MRLKLLAAAMLAVFFGTLTAASAAPLTPAEVAADAEVVRQADNVLMSEGYDGLTPYAAPLQQMLGKLPRPLTRLIAGSAGSIYLGDGSADCLRGLVLEAADQERGRKGQEVQCVVQPYATAAELLGAYYNEHQRGADALAVLSIGLEISPKRPFLASETGVAYALLKRWPESLAAYERGLKLEGLTNVELARLHRGRGFALTELGRLDEAVAAYRKSLEFEPDHGGARAELRYIERLRSGAPPTEPEITTGDESKARQ